jgi:hypothetical protein
MRNRGLCDPATIKNQQMVVGNGIKYLVYKDINIRIRILPHIRELTKLSGVLLSIIAKHSALANILRFFLHARLRFAHRNAQVRKLHVDNYDTQD